MSSACQRLKIISFFREHKNSEYFTEDENVNEFKYPVEEYPAKVSSMSLEKTPSISGVLTGIKGQYLMFDKEFVFNVRRHTSFEVEIIARG